MRVVGTACMFNHTLEIEQTKPIKRNMMKLLRKIPYANTWADTMAKATFALCEAPRVTHFFHRSLRKSCSR